MDKWDNIYKKDYQRISVFVGDNETELNFGWLSLTSSTPAIRYGYADDDVESYQLYKGIIDGERMISGVQYYSNKVTIKGLKPETSYKYQRLLNNVWEEPVEFNTQKRDSFSFVFVGDPQIGGSVNVKSFIHPDIGLNYDEAVRNDAFNWNMTVYQAFQMAGNPSLILSAGDQIDAFARPLNKDEANNAVLVENYEKELLIQEDSFSGFLLPDILKTVPSATCVGNHEIYTESYKQHFNTPNSFISPYKFRDSDSFIPGYNYFFKYNNVLVVVLETNKHYCDDFNMVVRKAIEKYPNTEWRIAMFHHDIFGNGQYHSQEYKIKYYLRPCLTKLFSDNKFDLVITGHDHIHASSYFIKYSNKNYDYNTKYKVGSIKKGEDKINTNPNGTLYITANCATASKLYVEHENLTEFDFINFSRQTFTSNFGLLNFEDKGDNVRLTINVFEANTYNVVDGPYIIEKSKRTSYDGLSKPKIIDKQPPDVIIIFDLII